MPGGACCLRSRRPGESSWKTPVRVLVRARLQPAAPGGVGHFPGSAQETESSRYCGLACLARAAQRPFLCARPRSRSSPFLQVDPRRREQLRAFHGLGDSLPCPPSRALPPRLWLTGGPSSSLSAAPSACAVVAGSALCCCGFFPFFLDTHLAVSALSCGTGDLGSLRPGGPGVAACGIQFPDQGWRLCPLHGPVAS